MSLRERPTSFSSRESTLSNQSDQSVRSARAAKVFGELITVGENENSLCYSPSPFPRKQRLSNITNVCQESPGRVLPFGTIQFPTTVKKAAEEQRIAKDCEEGKENEKPDQKNGKRNKGAISLVEKSAKNRKKVEKSVTSNKARGKNVKFKNTLPKRSEPLQFSSTREKRASLAEEAIRQATESVNQSLNASRAAKTDHNRHVAAEVARLRDEWKVEKEEAARFYAEMQKTKRERLDVANKICSQYARNKVDNDQAKWQERLTELDKEIKFKSEVYVEHKRKLKENEDKRRRISIAVKAEHRNIRRTNIEKMRLESIQEKHAFYEHKWAGERDAEEYRKKCEQERRESLAFRNAEGRRQRAEEEERQVEKRNTEHERLEHKWAGERDAEEYKIQCAQRRRESYAFRNAEGRCQRLLEQERQEEEKLKEHLLFEHKWAGERDAEEYKKQCAQERRESYAFRNAEGRRQRLEKEERQAQDKNAEHERLEHKWAGERDAEEYKIQCEQERRESLASRGRECVRHRAVMEELKALAKEREHESFLLKWAAQDDVKEYFAKVAEERRKSLVFRNAEGRRHRELEEQWRCDELQKAHELEQKRSECKFSFIIILVISLFHQVFNLIIKFKIS